MAVRTGTVHQHPPKGPKRKIHLSSLKRSNIRRRLSLEGMSFCIYVGTLGYTYTFFALPHFGLSYLLHYYIATASSSEKNSNNWWDSNCRPPGCRTHAFSRPLWPYKKLEKFLSYCPLIFHPSRGRYCVSYTHIHLGL